MNLADWANVGQLVEGVVAVVGLIGGGYVAIREVRRHREFLAIERRLHIAADVWRVADQIVGMIEGMVPPIPAGSDAFDGRVDERRQALFKANNELFTQASLARLVFPPATSETLLRDLDAISKLAVAVHTKLGGLRRPSPDQPVIVVDSATASAAQELGNSIFAQLQQQTQPPKGLGQRFLEAAKKVAEP